MGLLQYQQMLPALGLVMARVGGIVLAVPMFSSVQIPRMTKLLLVLILSLTIFPIVSSKLPTVMNLGSTAIGMGGEFLIGEVLGLAAGLTFFGAQMAGRIVSHQAGFALGEVFNPLFDEEFTVLDQLWFFAAFMLFLALRGHIAVISLVMRSFDLVPPMMLQADGSFEHFAVAMARSAFEVAMKLAGPAIVALMLTSLVLGFFTKTMPQMNILSVGFAFKSAIGLLLVALTIQFSEGVLSRALADGLDQAGLLMEHVAEGITHG
ncbi:MAG TPA: flagellar biosynthetic protein FliR [Phycisphaerae bacterium]|nr:flagellar biosynthetic protein FliR [Phycisphaerae bacterium]